MREIGCSAQGACSRDLNGVHARNAVALGDDSAAPRSECFCVDRRRGRLGGDLGSGHLTGTASCRPPTLAHPRGSGPWCRGDDACRAVPAGSLGGAFVPAGVAGSRSARGYRLDRPAGPPGHGLRGIGRAPAGDGSVYDHRGAVRVRRVRAVADTGVGARFGSGPVDRGGARSASWRQRPVARGCARGDAGTAHGRTVHRRRLRTSRRY